MTVQAQQYGREGGDMAARLLEVGDGGFAAPSFHPCRDLELELGFAVGEAPHRLDGRPSWFESDCERCAYWHARGSVLMLHSQPAALGRYGPPRAA